MRAAALIPFFAVAAIPSPLTVCGTCEYKTISAAVAKAPAGGTVLVKPGRYREGKLQIDKPLTLLGEGAPVIDGEGGDHSNLVVQADDVTVSGFMFTNTGVSFLQELAGIRFVRSRNCEVSKNRFENTTYGVYLEKTDGCRILDNVFVGNAKDESSSGNAIHVWNGSGHRIERNRIGNHRDGIYFEFVKDSHVAGNMVDGNIRYGLHFMSSERLEYLDNTFSRNGAGVAVMYSKGITMLRNRFIRNRGPSTYGLLLKDINASRIEDNDFVENSIAIYMEGSSRSTFTRNLVADNGWSLQIMGNCDSNVFSHNVFRSNTFDVGTNSDSNPNTFEENYWSKYRGYDLDGNGRGDVPYRPASISSIIMERADSSFILLNSFLFALLDEVERALPELIPERLKDGMPLMQESEAGLR